MTRLWTSVALLAAMATPALTQQTATRDHSVTVTSTVPVIAGKKSKLYVRERALPSVLKTGAGDKVVLFVHGAGTPAEVSFDVPYQDYSWMGYLAAAGFDVFTVDMTGYGRSARPAPMNDKCNLSPEQQKSFSVNCPQTYPGALTNIESDWNDISATVAYIKKLRHVEKVNLIAWSQGGPRAGGWTANHPDQVARLILLAPAYNRATKSDAP
ncbi:MAG TPA: alpha/beta fold hydrolase, partial [Rhizomicrobium sp.]|nr:alpha/beta fold hydrolase [Rhizomicrobium sp.]